MKEKYYCISCKEWKLINEMKVTGFNPMCNDCFHRGVAVMTERLKLNENEDGGIKDE